MYSVFVQLCNNCNVTPYQAAKDAGINKSTLTRWKNGTCVPRASTLRKLADYFGVDVDCFKGEPSAPAPSDSGEPTASELMEYLEMLRSRSECRMLFSLARDATPEDVRRAVAVIEALRREEGRE